MVTATGDKLKPIRRDRQAAFRPRESLRAG
jgi:hypothetical protein